MRPTNSAYDRNAAASTTALLEALRRAHTVTTPVTGSVIVDGDEIEREEWDRMAMSWDGSANGLEDLGWEDAAEAMREAEQDRADQAEEIYDAAGEDGMVSAEDSVAIAGPARPDAHGQTDMRGLARKLGCLAELEALIVARA